MNAVSSCTSCFRSSTRREWIRQFTMSCTAYAGLAGSWTPPAASAAPVNLDQRLRLDINAFPSLALNGGSTIITYNNENTTILINREGDTEFHAMDPTCPHMGCRVEPYSISNNRITCPCHGSEFDIRGLRERGPAVTGLNTYPTQFEDASTLHIEIPGFVHRIDEFALHSSTAVTTRVKLTFPTVSGGQYQVRHSPDLGGTFQMIPFATTAGGLANKTTHNGTGAPMTVYADADNGAGFFSIELLIYQLAP